MATSAVALALIWTLSHPEVPGLRPMEYMTIGEKSQGGPLRPVAWRDLEGLETALPGLRVCEYADAIVVTAQSSRGTIALRVAAASANLFQYFVYPLVARMGTAYADGGLSGAKSVVLNFKTAQRLYGSPSAALDKYLRINGIELRVTGVTSESFTGLFEDDIDAWIPPSLVVPLYFDYHISGIDVWRRVPVFYALAAGRNGRGAGTTARVGRLLQQAQNSGPKLTAVAGITNDPARTQLLKTWSGLAVFISTFLTVASALTAGGLLLARQFRQLDEVRLKRILGAGSLRLAVELVVGPVSLVITGFSGALVLGGLMLSVIGRLHLSNRSISLDWQDVITALLMQLPLALSAAGAVGLVPALRLIRDSGTPRTAYWGTGTRRASRVLEAVVVAQIVSCICAGIVAVNVGLSVMALSRQGLGYKPANRAVIAVSMRGSGSFSTNSIGGSLIARAFDRVMQRVSSLPGVKGAAVALAAPLDPSARSLILTQPGLPGDERHGVTYNGITSNYFQALGTSMLVGHTFTSGIAAGDPTEAIVNETLRKQLWPGASPVGKDLRLDDPETGMSLGVVVTGVSADERMGGPKESAQPTVYLPLSGNIFATNLPIYLVVDGQEPLFRLEAAINDELSSAFPGLGVVSSYRIESRLQGALSIEKRRAFIAFGGAMAIVLAAFIGLYSSLVYFIASRRRELAIRICCGATTSMIFRLVLARATRGGMAAALISAIFWVPLRHLVLGGWIGAASWSVTTAIAVTLICVGAVAVISVFPALRASRMNPNEAIRDQI
ncbi:MAG: ABC transporter permease [Acidobacteriota bacterium]|nr:ABC transporter permease [Acidobacteriota bacterium]